MRLLLTALALTAACPAGAQHAGHHQPSPAEARAESLRRGQGMGMAMPAERNGYPGPRHVLDLADKLKLTPAQHARTKGLFERMSARAKQLGEELLAAEAELDGLFGERRADAGTRHKAVARVAETEAALKLTHLEAHIEMMALLTPEQVARYVELRNAPPTGVQPAHH